MRVIAIDPGNRTSGWVLMEGRKVIEGHSEQFNEGLIGALSVILREGPFVDVIACEWIQSYGMAVGKEVFHTCRWVGRMEQALDEYADFRLVYRRDVKMHLCNSVRAKDANVRQAILDMYEPTGGGSRPQIGTKKQPGPLYGVSGHMWPAVGLALTVQEADSITEVAA